MRSAVKVTAGSVMLAVTVLAQGAKQIPANDVILRAMQDEIERSKALRVVGLDDPPYYIEYGLEDVDVFSASAALGSLLSANRNRARSPQVKVRAGSYEFDSTNHVGSMRGSGSHVDNERWPIDDNYGALRHNLWLATDGAYKTALEAIARKRSSLKNMAAPETMADFFKTTPIVDIRPPAKVAIDETAWKNRVKDLSSIFVQYPELHLSGVDVSLYTGTSYLVNSEGSVQREPDILFQVRAQGQAQAADGMILHDQKSFQSIEANGLPPDVEMKRAVTELADNMRALLKAPVGEGYSGPVLFEAQAAAQLMAQVLGDNLRQARRPVSDPGRPAPYQPSELETKLGSRILPDWISVVDDATQTEFRGHKLVGYYPFDMEGVPPSPLQIVDKGVLKTFLLTRQPVKGFNASNGHARVGGAFGANGAAIGNLFIKASETKPAADLKKQLIEMIQQRNKPYGMLVRKLDYPSSATFRELQSIAQSMQASGGSHPVTPPVLVYKVYPDGREELVRGLRFRGLNARALRDIVAASDENYVFDFINNGAPFALSGLGGFLAPASVVSPALLFEEVEFERPQDEQSKPPLTPPPPMEISGK